MFLTNCCNTILLYKNLHKCKSKQQILYNLNILCHFFPLWLERITGFFFFWLWGDRFCEFQLMIQSKKAFYTFSFSSALLQNPVCATVRSVLALQIFISHFFFVFLTSLDTTKNHFIILSVARSRQPHSTLYTYIYIFLTWYESVNCTCVSLPRIALLTVCSRWTVFLMIGWCGSRIERMELDYSISLLFVSLTCTSTNKWCAQFNQQSIV